MDHAGPSDKELATITDPLYVIGLNCMGHCIYTKDRPLSREDRIKILSAIGHLQAKLIYEILL